MSLPALMVQGAGRSMLIMLLALGLVGCIESATGPELPTPDPGSALPGEETGGDPEQGTEPPAGENPPDDADPPGMVSTFYAKLKTGGYWDGFWTGSPSKLTTNHDGSGTNQERNASIKWLGGIAGVEDPDRFLTRGRIRFRLKINADGLEHGGGGKHLVNLASTPLSRGRRDLGRVTRVEIDNPCDPHPRFVLHNYVDGQGGATDLGDLPFSFSPDEWVEIDWSWELDGRQLTMVCNGQTYRATLLEGSEGPGRYWGSGHMETNHGGGEFTFGSVEVSER